MDLCYLDIFVRLLLLGVWSGVVSSLGSSILYYICIHF